MIQLVCDPTPSMVKSRRSAPEASARAKMSPNPPIETERHEQADRQERHELDDRLEGDGSHHAFMLLARIDMTGSEQDREQRHDEGHVKPGVLQDGRARRSARHHDLGILQQHRKAGRDRLELQRDVGEDPDHRDDGDQCAELEALAVARRDEIRDRGGPVHLADPDDLADHEPGQDEGERRAEVDRQEVDAARRRPSDRAVERPGRAVDRDRQRVDRGIGDQAAPLVGALVAVICDRKQQAEIEQGYGDDDRTTKHRSALRGLGLLRGRSAPHRIRRLPARRSTASATSAISAAQTANR